MRYSSEICSPKDRIMFRFQSDWESRAVEKHVIIKEVRQSHQQQDARTHLL